MLWDRAKINVSGGHGGAGSVRFRREKYVPKGGPNGGDGGSGGDVVLVASRQVRDLATFRHKHHFKAPAGGAGQGANKHGADGAELLVEVPVGTEVRDDEGALLGDLVAEGERLIVAQGGEGGRGNACFKSSRRQTPRFAERGLSGEERWISLSLKLLADVGLVGLPNAGKSSLLAGLTRAHPRIASYPFTTLEPNLGVLAREDGPIVIADIPGLIEGASEGAGLGDKFLAHVERTAALVYVVDASEDEASTALETVRWELGTFRPVLLQRPAVVALNKVDLVDEGRRREALRDVETLEWARRVVPVSAVSGEGLDDLAAELAGLVEAVRASEAEAATAARAEAEVIVLRPGQGRLEDFVVRPEGDAFRVEGEAIQRLIAKADLENEEAVAYLQDVIERAGLNEALRRAGAVPGDTVIVGETALEFA